MIKRIVIETNKKSCDNCDNMEHGRCEYLPWPDNGHFCNINQSTRELLAIVCCYRREKGDTKPAVANLIDAASDLLKACKDAENLLSGIAGSVEPILPVLNKLSAAITKAEKFIEK